MSVNSSGTYLLGVDIDANVPTGAKLAMHLFPRTEGDGKVALSGKGDNATFYSDDGAEITTVPENHHVNVAVELTAGITYAPVIEAVTSNSTPDNGNGNKNADNASGSGGGGGGGCDAGLAGIAALGLIPLFARKQW